MYKKCLNLVAFKTPVHFTADGKINIIHLYSPNGSIYRIKPLEN